MIEVCEREITDERQSNETKWKDGEKNTHTHTHAQNINWEKRE